MDQHGLQKLWSAREEFMNEVKERFRREYLSLLVHHGKKKFARKFEIGDVVLVGSDNKKRLDWIMARVEKLLPGKDGKLSASTCGGEKYIDSHPATLPSGRVFQ